MRPSHDESALTPFRIAIPEETLSDLRFRLQAPRYPHPLPGDDWSTGVPLSYLRALVEEWRQFDWRSFEARLNRLPHFTTPIDGQIIHFIHARSPVPGSVPLLLIHGWPSSFLEFVDLIGPLTDPRSVRRHRSGRFRRGDPVTARLHVLHSPLQHRLDDQPDRRHVAYPHGPARL
ncbi:MULTISPECIES: epoxide hydrolase N-terminal domain-containing protein [Thermobifida]|uniref:epoxide hydrolase N-terminal domain-containing protein n=1 Tax=Thermobifida TaxID=83677 RepID=UPI00215796FA|nr:MULTISPECIES: epoxide hydrolase N-terminal domain-containing protein [Thermobifida]